MERREFAICSQNLFSPHSLVQGSIGVVPGLQPRLRRRREQEDENVFHFASSNFSTFSKIVPFLSDFATDYPLPRRFWSLNVPDEGGYWERQVQGSWVRRGVEEEKFVAKFRVEKYVFNQLHQKYGAELEKEVTNMRSTIPGRKRLAILLHWLAVGGSYEKIGDLYNVGHSTVCTILHDAIDVLVRRLVPEVIVFPEGQELQAVIRDFESLCYLPQCCGAVDGTFMKMSKPTEFGDAYRCYKGYPAILVLGCVDARGIFSNINAGRPGSVGDAFTFNRSQLCARLANGQWGGAPPRHIHGQAVLPYLVGDAAFALTTKLMKCFDGQNMTNQQENFNYCVIRTRRVVEQAFGRLKGRWHVLVNNFLRDSVFCTDVALVCCALHNVCERAACPFEDSWVPADTVPIPGGHGGAAGIAAAPALMLRNALAQYVSGIM